MKVLSFGEILWDIIECTPYLGGAPFNVAAHLAQCGVASYMISRLGKDELGKKAYGQARQLGVDTSLLQWDDRHPTSTVDVYLKAGQPDYTIHEPVAWDFIEQAPLQRNVSTQTFDSFYFGTLAQRNETSRQTLQWILQNKKFDTVFYDVNLRKGLLERALISPSLQYCDIFKLNEDEVAVLADLLYGKVLGMEDFAGKIQQDYQVKILIITASEKGCYVYDGQGLHHIPGQQIIVVDAVGAGDAFSAAFLFKYLQDKDPLKAARIANHLGGFVASSRGPIPAYTPEIKEMLNA